MGKATKAHTPAPPPPPAHLTAEAKGWWERVVKEYGIADEAGLLMLRGALESFDRAEQARAILAKEGLTLTDRYGQHKPHPAAGIERDARKVMLTYLKSLNLDAEPLHPGPGRPPRR